MSVQNEDKSSFCMSCGARNDASNAFCLACGEKLLKIAAEEPVVTEEQSEIQPAKEHEEGTFGQTEVQPIKESEEHASQQTAAMSSVPEACVQDTAVFAPARSVLQEERPQQIGSTPQESNNSADRAGKSQKGLVIALIISSALLLITLTAVAVLFLKGADPFNNENKAAQETSQVAEESQKSARLEEKEDSKASDKRENDNIDKVLLFEVWQDCGSIDTEIRDLATDFNAHWKQGVVPLEQAENIQYKVSKLRKTLAKVSAQSGSNEAVRKLENLVSDLEARVSVIKEACVLVVNGASEQSVLDVLSRDNIGGINKYKKDFEENYSAARP